MRRALAVSVLCLAFLSPLSVSAQGTPAAGARLAADARLAGARAGDKAALSDQWKKGARMAADGEKLMRESQSKLARLSEDATKSQARADAAVAARGKQEAAQARGQHMVDEGRSLQAQAEDSFHAGPSAS